MSRAMSREPYIENTAFIGYGLIIPTADYRKLPKDFVEDERWENFFWMINCGSQDDYFVGACLSETNYYATLDLRHLMSTKKMLECGRFFEELSKYLKFSPYDARTYFFARTYETFI